MRIANPCDWVIERVKSGTPFFSVRVNDGEFTQMYRTKPQGAELGTVDNPAPCRWELGDALRQILDEIDKLKDRSNILIGHCCHDDPDHQLNKLFWGQYCGVLQYLAEAGGHWPLDGVVDGSTVRMIDALRGRNSRLVTSEKLAEASKCLGGMDPIIVPAEDSWKVGNEWAKKSINPASIAACGGRTLVWAAGAGLKPLAWDLFKRFPQSSHLDVGHLFNGAFGLRDYGWLQRGDGPWYRPYMDNFVPYVRGFIK